MRVMLIAFVAVFAIAILADIGLDRIGFSSADRQSSESVRLE